MRHQGKASASATPQEAGNVETRQGKRIIKEYSPSMDGSVAAYRVEKEPRYGDCKQDKVQAVQMQNERGDKNEDGSLQ